jgi:cytochrome d ubiquinol oxidase subunit I
LAFAEDGTMIATSFVDVIFNPSTCPRASRTWCWRHSSPRRWWCGRVGICIAGEEGHRGEPIALRMAILMMAIVAPLQVVVGHESGMVAHEHQPAKVAAMEGWWRRRHSSLRS